MRRHCDRHANFLSIVTTFHYTGSHALIVCSGLKQAHVSQDEFGRRLMLMIPNMW